MNAAPRISRKAEELMLRSMGLVPRLQSPRQDVGRENAMSPLKALRFLMAIPSRYIH
jgi:hypothetical protein